MKLYRILAVLLVAGLIITAIGCSDKKETDNSDNTQASVEADTGVETEAPIIAPVELYKLEIVNEDVNSEKYSARLSYPAVDGYSSSEIEEKVNALIRSYTFAKMDYALAQTGAYTHVNYNIDSLEVTFKNEKFFSAICHVSIQIDGESDTIKGAYGINVDVKNSRIVGFESIINFDEFVIAFGNGHFGQTEGYEKLLEETTFDDIITPYSELYSIYPEFFVRANNDVSSLGIIADTVPVLGYFAVFEDDVTDDKYVNDVYFELVSDNK